jgi:hypothetical protein
MADSTENQLGRIARYDGWADGYDEYLTTPLYEKMPAHLARLVGRGRGLCVDLGCGTGVHLAVLGSLGWSVIESTSLPTGPFVKMEGGSDGVARIYSNYRETRRTFVGPGIGQGIRSKIGVRHVPLAEMLNKLVEAGLQLVRVEELGDGTVPWLFAFVASKP